MSNNKSPHIQPESLDLSLVSVLLPVYNGGVYLEDSIRSILSQTYSNFELIIINDGSTDKSAEVVEQFKDPRIRFYDQPNQGLAASLNRAVELAKGKYLARQDADDVSFPRRFEKQVAFLEAHPEYGIVGTWSEIYEETRKTDRGHKHPTNNDVLKFNLIFDSYFVHSSVMLRKTVFDKVGLYSTEKARQPEDYELWSRVIRNNSFKVANIPEALVIYREVVSSLCRSGVYLDAERLMNMCAENLAWASGRDLSDPAVTDIAALIHNTPHRFSQKLDFRTMLSVLQETARRVSGTSDSANSLLIEQVKERYKCIRNNYGKHKLESLNCKIMKLLLQIIRKKIHG